MIDQNFDVSSAIHEARAAGQGCKPNEHLPMMTCLCTFVPPPRCLGLLPKALRLLPRPSADFWFGRAQEPCHTASPQEIGAGMKPSGGFATINLVRSVSNVTGNIDGHRY